MIEEKYLKLDWRVKYFPELLKRLLRIDIFNILIKKDIELVVLKKKLVVVYKSSDETITYSVDKGSRPLNNGVLILDKVILFGDYWSNKDREAACIRMINLENQEKEVFFSFDWIRHIHFIQLDCLDNNYIFVGTGDSDSESGIYKINLYTKRVEEIIGNGSQTFRAVSILQVENDIVWGSDDPDDNNFIYSYNRQSKELNKVYEIAGPAYYSTKDKVGNLYIATTIENRKKHKAIIYKSADDGKTWINYKEFKKDLWHIKYFGYGVIEFINTQENFETLYYNLKGLKKNNE